MTWPELTDAERMVRLNVAVIVVNWNGERFIRRCLSALLDQTVSPREIIVVDNASTDSSRAIIREYPSVRLLAQKGNLGFAGGNNLACAAVLPESEWVALLNPDAFPDPRWLETLLMAVRNHPDFAVFGSKLLNADHPDVLDGEGDIFHVSGLAWRACHGRANENSGKDVRPIFSPCAAAALYRKDAFRDVRGFDEDFFCYMEDVDLGFRLKLRGYRALYVPDAVVYHVGSASTGHRHSEFAVYHGHRNLVWTYVKNMPGVLFWLLLPVHLAANIVSCFYFLFKGQGRTIAKAKWDAIKGLPGMWNKRRQIQAERRVSVTSIWRALDKGLPSVPAAANEQLRKGAR